MWQIIDNYIGIIFMMIGVILFGRIVLDEPFKISVKHLMILILIICLVHDIIYNYLTGTIKTIIISFINMYLYKYIFKISSFKALFLVFLCTLILIIPDALELIIATSFLGVSKTFYYNEYAGGTMCNLIVSIMFIIMIIPLRKGLKKIINIKIENNIKIIIYIILTFICLSILFYKEFSNIIISIELIISLFAMLVFIIILFSLIKQTIDNDKLTKEYDKLLEFMTTYENEIEKQRILRHEVKNEFRAIRAKICDKQDNKEIVEYIDEILKDKIIVKQEEYAKLGYLPPNGIKGLCYFKVQEAEEKGIQVALNISKRIEQSTIYDLDIKEQRDFGRILGVFLDNAIEASKNSEKKQLGIEAYINEEKEFRMIISNTYDNQIEKEKIGKESFSTKGKGRGHGLLLVKHLTESSEVFETRTDIQEKIYVQTIIIKKK